ncbi:MAG: hypothetical protein QOJ16_1933 [Acidobacteriota bacterium]|jgi:hypothetical protein|nr:hypothetical protein [Acidobacteriota bacterium]
MSKGSVCVLLALVAMASLGVLTLCEDGCACCSITCVSCSCCQIPPTTALVLEIGADPGSDAGPAFVGPEGAPRLHEPRSVFHVPKLG